MTMRTKKTGTFKLICSELNSKNLSRFLQYHYAFKKDNKKIVDIILFHCCNNHKPDNQNIPQNRHC